MACTDSADTASHSSRRLDLITTARWQSASKWRRCGRHLLLSRQVLASATRLAKYRRAQRGEPVKDVVAECPRCSARYGRRDLAAKRRSIVRSRQLPRATCYDGADCADSPLAAAATGRQRMCNPRVPLICSRNASRRGGVGLKLASRHTQRPQLVVGLVCARRLVFLCVNEVEIGARRAPGPQNAGHVTS